MIVGTLGSFGETKDGGMQDAHEALPRRMSILEGAILRRRHDEVLYSDLVELSERVALSHRRHVIQAKTETKLLQI